MTTEAKGRDSIKTQNHLNFIFTTNHQSPIRASMHARRYFLTTASTQHLRDAPYWTALWDEINNPICIRELLGYLVSLPLDRWHPAHNVPLTDDLAEVKRDNDPFLNLMVEWLSEGILPRYNRKEEKVVKTWPQKDERVMFDELWSGLEKYLEEFSLCKEVLKMGGRQFITRMKEVVRIQHIGQSRKFEGPYVFPSLETAIEQVNKKAGQRLIATANPFTLGILTFIITATTTTTTILL